MDYWNRQKMSYSRKSQSIQDCNISYAYMHESLAELPETNRGIDEIVYYISVFRYVLVSNKTRVWT